MIHATINMRRTHSNSQRVSKSDPLRFIPSIRLARRDGLAAAETRLQQADGLHPGAACERRSDLLASPSLPSCLIRYTLQSQEARSGPGS